MRVETAGGPFLEITEGPGGAPVVRVGLGEEGDWFGPGRATGPAVDPSSAPATGNDPAVMGESAVTESTGALGRFRSVVVMDGAVRCSVLAYDDVPMLVFRTEATTDLTGLATGSFDDPSVGWPVFSPGERGGDGAPEGLKAIAFQHCEFGLPTMAGPDLDGFFLLPHRPPTGWPLLLTAGDGRTLLVAPLGDFHDVTIGLNGGTVRCGWHGDLESVPAGFATDLAVIAGDGPRVCLDRWGKLITEQAGTVRPGRWADALATRPSYWTDNGAAYWYRTEPGHDVAGSIVAAVEELRSNDVPLGAVQLDSWFYPHVDLRPFDTDEWVVPPSAMVAWEERDDVLPEGIVDLRNRLGNPPLVAHIRHLSSEAAIAAELPVHVDGPYAAPATSAIYERWLDQCVAWGVETFEHDWLVEVFFGVRGLRAAPGRARAWQEGIDRAARERGITLQWCMGTPADMAQTATLTQVTSVRTCGDHGYIATAGQLWAWFCTTNALARSLGLMPFKDVFRTDPEADGANGELEALLSVLSTGPVGLGDRVGRFDFEVARRTCRADGVLIKPHVPIAAIDASILSSPAFNPVLMVAECHSDHPAGRWGYVVAMHSTPVDDQISGDVALDELGAASPSGPVFAWDWRSATGAVLEPGASVPVELEREGWRYLVLAPLLVEGRLAVVGDASTFATAGDARIEVSESVGRVVVTIKGAGEEVTLTGWAASRPTVEGDAAGAVEHDAATGVWSVQVAVPARGWTSVEVSV